MLQLKYIIMLSIALLIIVGAIIYFISLSRLSKNHPGHLQATYEAKFSRFDFERSLYVGCSYFF